jgi:hypothetical protein
MSDKLQVIKHLMNTYQGEIPEVHGFWVLIRAPMPSPWVGAWYHKQYAQSEQMRQVGNVPHMTMAFTGHRISIVRSDALRHQQELHGFDD